MRTLSLEEIALVSGGHVNADQDPSKIAADMITWTGLSVIGSLFFGREVLYGALFACGIWGGTLLFKHYFRKKEMLTHPPTIIIVNSET